MEKRYISAFRCWKIHSQQPLGTSSISSAVYPKTFKASWEKTMAAPNTKPGEILMKIFSQNEFLGDQFLEKIQTRVDIMVNV